jgi:hypothetical protein
MAKCKFIAALLCVSAFLVCQSAKVKESIVKVGNTTLDGEALVSVTEALKVYPAPLPYYFPAQRQPQTIMAECEAIYRRAGSKKAAEISKKVAASRDWAWKQRYIAAQAYFEFLQENLGIPDKQLIEYYKKHAEEFKVTTRVASGQDSSYVPPFDSVKTRVADRCFYDTHKPDAAFIERVGDVDSATVMTYWIYTVRTNPQDFFMRLIFKERTGTEYADSLEQLYDGKTLTAEDMGVIATWLPESRKQMSDKYRAEWLFKWLTFSERAEKLGITATPSFKNKLHWVQRIEFALEYLRSEVLPKIEPAGAFTSLDSTLAELLAYDKIGQARVANPQPLIAAALNDIMKTRLAVAVDSALYAIRKGAKVKFLSQSKDRRDEKGSDPAALVAKADSLREVASDPNMDMDTASKIMSEAEKLYNTLSTDFAFTAVGRKALGEMAKVMIDKYNTDPKQGSLLVTTAIKAYRKSQMLDADPDGMCNSYFLVGFAYDEHLKNYSLAEANYKWILRNAPACALASDAEFMIQHLGEPVTSIEEIQGQSLRQGREVDFDEGGETL